MTAAHRWMLALGTIRPRGHVHPTMILVQAAAHEHPAEIRPDGVMWQFLDGSTLIIDSDGVRATPAIEGTV